MNCVICGKAPATRKISYNGSAGLLDACNKKTHDLDATERRRMKTLYRGVKRQHKVRTLKNPLNQIEIPKLGEVIKRSYEKVKFALTRRDQKK
jgi:hypothetical protein